MLAYAANSPVVVDRKPHPNAMLAIIAVHVALLAVVMSAKMEFRRHPLDPPIIIEPIPVPQPPPPNPLSRPARPQPGPTVWHDPTPVPPLPDPTFPRNPTFDPSSPPEPGTVTIPQPDPTPVGVSSGPQLLTPASELKPPYPLSKLLNEEEAVLRLKLTIDDRGRVVAVEPVGRTDAAFLDAARRHLIAHWRYKPALNDGRPVASSAVITLRFELNG
jgi:periplasmic protein TonB